MHQLEKQQFQQLSRWRRFVQTGEISHIRHLRDLFGFVEYNNYVLSCDYENKLVLPPKAEIFEQLGPGINRVAAELFIPGVIVTLAAAEASFHNDTGLQVSCRLKIDRGPQGAETTALWRSLYFGKEVVSVLADPELTYDRWIQNAIFRCMTKSQRTQFPSSAAGERVRSWLKPEYYPAYNLFVEYYSRPNSGLPWGM